MYIIETNHTYIEVITWP